MITYLIGDATRPQGQDCKIIAHVCNDRGGWGRGFVLALSKRWSEPENRYRAGSPLELGKVQFVVVERDDNEIPKLFVANMIAQKGYGKNNRNLHRTSEADSEIPLQYDALQQCLMLVAEEAREQKASIHMPRIGCGLAGGSWEHVEAIIDLTCYDVPVFVYDLPNYR